ncbi:MAG: hypothetical protein ACI4AE_00830 [Candidatus Cryptobacteroides sp.]
MKKYVITLCSAVLVCTALTAQTPARQRGNAHQEVRERGTRHRKDMTPEEKAARISDQMRKELGISDKQYKKVYKLFLKDEKALAEQAEQRPGPQGMPGEVRPQGGKQEGGSGQGGPEFGGHGGAMGGHGGPGSGFGGPQGGRQRGGHGGPEMGLGPQGPEFHGGSDVFSEEYIEKREKKLRKILKDDLYNKWRERHPIEMPPLPEPFQMPDNQQ